jgi:hypothetical protein
MRDPGVVWRGASRVKFTMTDTRLNGSAAHAKSPQSFLYTDSAEHLPLTDLTVPLNSVNELRRSFP